MTDVVTAGVFDSGAMPWLAAPLVDALATQRAHAMLVQAAPGDGALGFVLALAQAWLCEAGEGVPAAAACRRCTACRLVESHAHADLHVLFPETLRRELEWPARDDKPDADDAKRKPSRQIRVPEVRSMIDWATRTGGRSRGKVVVVHPAESLNVTAASALLKTLEEPPQGTRLILSAADPGRLLPTVRSRCQTVRVAGPGTAQANAWLAERGVAAPEVLLAACSGRPLDALAMARSGVDAVAWAAFPRALAQGRAAALAGWSVARALDALGKLCHDAMAAAGGASPRFFPPDALPAAHGDMARLVAWAEEIARLVEVADHPWNENLMHDALAAAARRALAPGAGHATNGVDGSPRTAAPLPATRLATLGR